MVGYLLRVLSLGASKVVGDRLLKSVGILVYPSLGTVVGKVSKVTLPVSISVLSLLLLRRPLVVLGIS